MIIPRLCKQCNKNLEGHEYRKIFCDSSCAAKYNMSKRVIPIRTCQNCGSRITTGSTKQKCCSIKCRSEIKIKRHLRCGTWMTSGLRNWIYKTLDQKCVECGVGNLWNGKQLRLQVDHINGNPKDNRLENLQILCPNCHTQTENWGIKNISSDGKIKMKHRLKVKTSINSCDGKVVEPQPCHG